MIRGAHKNTKWQKKRRNEKIKGDERKRKHIDFVQLK